jgi:hypothetical protein
MNDSTKNKNDKKMVFKSRKSTAGEKRIHTIRREPRVASVPKRTLSRPLQAPLNTKVSDIKSKQTQYHDTPSATKNIIENRN